MSGQPGAHDVQLWTIALDAPGSGEAADWRCLEPAEQARAARLVFAADRRRFIARRAALRRLVARRTGAEPAALRWACGRFGRLHLPGHQLDFSLSHRGERALIALAGSGRPGPCPPQRLGIDLERIAPGHAEPAMLQAHLAADALAPCSAALQAGQSRPFFRWWTVIEAMAKARGTGLAEEPPVPAAAAWLHGPVQLPDEEGLPWHWQLQGWDLAAGHVAALVCGQPTAALAPPLQWHPPVGPDLQPCTAGVPVPPLPWQPPGRLPCTPA